MVDWDVSAVAAGQVSPCMTIGAACNYSQVALVALRLLVGASRSRDLNPPGLAPMARVRRLTGTVDDMLPVLRDCRMRILLLSLSVSSKLITKCKYIVPQMVTGKNVEIRSSG